MPDSRPNWQNLYQFSDRNVAKTLPDGAAHTCTAYVRDPPPPPPTPRNGPGTDHLGIEELASEMRVFSKGLGVNQGKG